MTFVFAAVPALPSVPVAVAPCSCCCLDDASHDVVRDVDVDHLEFQPLSWLFRSADIPPPAVIVAVIAIAALRLRREAAMVESMKPPSCVETMCLFV